MKLVTEMPSRSLFAWKRWRNSQAGADGGRRTSRGGLSRQRVAIESSRNAAHLAIAAVGKIKYLLTWNCNHLANAQLLDRLEPIAAIAGFKLPRVCTPEELMGVSAYE